MTKTRKVNQAYSDLKTVKNNGPYFIFPIFGVLFLFLSLDLSFTQLTITVELTVPLLIEKGGIYPSTDHNKQHSGDPDYEISKLDLPKYAITLYETPAHFEYKFTQGSWATAEGTQRSQALPNRNYIRNESNQFVLDNNILGWEEQKVYSVIVNSIPDNTPKDARIYI